MDNIIVLKIGGSMLDSLTDDFLNNIKKLTVNGFKPVIVHGGGPAIKTMLDRLQIESSFINGLRVTTEATMEVVEMVLAGKLNQDITQRFNNSGLTAVGLSGSDANLLTANAKDFQQYGFVGNIKSVNTKLIKQLVNEGIVPVIAPVAVGEDNKKYNINADTAAGVIANHLVAKQLIFITDVPGIMKNNQLIETITNDEINKLISENVIYGGMIPKVQAALASLNEQRQEVVISDGKQLFTQNCVSLVGTTIKKFIGVASK